MKEYMNTLPCTNDEFVVESKSQYLISFKKYLVFPIVAGFKGFRLVFFIVISLKLLSFLLSSTGVFNLDLLDFMLAFTGFALMFLVNILKSFH